MPDVEPFRDDTIVTLKLAPEMRYTVIGHNVANHSDPPIVYRLKSKLGNDAFWPHSCLVAASPAKVKSTKTKAKSKAKSKVKAKHRDTFNQVAKRIAERTDYGTEAAIESARALCAPDPIPPEVAQRLADRAAADTGLDLHRAIELVKSLGVAMPESLTRRYLADQK